MLTIFNLTYFYYITRIYLIFCNKTTKLKSSQILIKEFRKDSKKIFVSLWVCIRGSLRIKILLKIHKDLKIFLKIENFSSFFLPLFIVYSWTTGDEYKHLYLFLILVYKFNNLNANLRKITINYHHSRPQECFRGGEKRGPPREGL